MRVGTGEDGEIGKTELVFKTIPRLSRGLGQVDSAGHCGG